MDTDSEPLTTTAAAAAAEEASLQDAGQCLGVAELHEKLAQKDEVKLIYDFCTTLK